jgi:hypothetical protein
MTGAYGAVDLTRRRGDAEEDSENELESQNLRTQRKRRDFGSRHLPCPHVGAVGTHSQPRTVTEAAARSPRISADSVISGFDFLSVFLRVSASPRQMDRPFSSSLARMCTGPR